MRALHSPRTSALACVAAIIGGAGNGIELPAIMGLVQQLSPSEMHGRLIGAVESITALSLAAGLVLGGALVALISVRPAFAVVAAATIATAGALMLLTRSGSVPRHQAGPAAAAPVEDAALVLRRPRGCHEAGPADGPLKCDALTAVKYDRLDMTISSSPNVSS